jgi:hypothetical protein
MAAARCNPTFRADLRTTSPEHCRLLSPLSERGGPGSPTPRPIWVSLPDQLQFLCRDRRDSLNSSAKEPDEAAQDKDATAMDPSEGGDGTGSLFYDDIHRTMSCTVPVTSGTQGQAFRVSIVSAMWRLN